MANSSFNAQTIIDTIQEQLDLVLLGLQQDATYGKEMKKIIAVRVYNEQAFKSLKDNELINKGYIFVVVKFGRGTVNYGAAAIPITLTIFGYKNSINPTQLLLNTFVSYYTTKIIGDDDTSTQVWQTPSVFSNFNEVEDHFRSTFTVTGTLIFGNSTVKMNSLQYYQSEADIVSGKYESIQFMSFEDTYSASAGPQPFGHTNGFAVSEINFSTNTISMAMYLLDSKLLDDIMAVKGFRSTVNGHSSSKSGRNADFFIIFSYSNGFTNAPANASSPTQNEKVMYTWKLLQCSISQPLGDITKISVSFTH